MPNMPKEKNDHKSSSHAIFPGVRGWKSMTVHFQVNFLFKGIVHPEMKIVIICLPQVVLSRIYFLVLLNTKEHILKNVENYTVLGHH